MKKKIYICDCCGKQIDDPCLANMREFYIGYRHFGDVVRATNKSDKRRVDLCGECFERIGNYGKGE